MFNRRRKDLDMARKKVSSKEVSSSKKKDVVEKNLQFPTAGAESPVPLRSTPEVEKMLKQLENSRGFLISYTTLVLDPNNVHKMMLKHTILHNTFPLADILPSVKHIKDLCVQMMESEPESFGVVDLQEHVE